MQSQLSIKPNAPIYLVAVGVVICLFYIDFLEKLSFHPHSNYLYKQVDLKNYF
jgi:hypothetical protein